MNNKQPTKTAAQRLDGLEAAMSTLDNAVFNMSRQLQTMNEAVTMLADKLAAITSLLSSGQQVSNETIDAAHSALKIAEMKGKVDALLQEGSVTKAEEITENSFIVVRELDLSSGSAEVLNPRLQFVARAVGSENLSKLLGKKAGDQVAFTENVNSVVEIEEIYEITVQTPAPTNTESNEVTAQQ